jgi:hypothetical protein
MARVKRDKKHEVVKPSDDCSCSSTDSSSSSSTDCSERKYDEHCEVKRSEGKTHCRRKCRTICVVECEKEVHHKYEWCYKTKEDKKWCPIEAEKIPKKCDEDHHDDKKHDDKKHVVKK